MFVASLVSTRVATPEGTGLSTYEKHDCELVRGVLVVLVHLGCVFVTT